MIGQSIVVAILLIIILIVVRSWVRDLRRDRRLTHPLGTIAGLYGTALVLYVAASAYWLSRGFVLGGGRRGSACVDTAFSSGGGAGSGHTALAGASISATSNIQACALHPSLAQWALFLLTKMPDMVLWGWLLLLVWQLVSRASRGGPFTARTASTMHQLGWVVIGGSMTAGVLVALGADLLTRMLMTPATYSGAGVALDILIFAPLKALLPVPALAGAALLSFARIIRAGAVLDEEIKATV
jgi:hypothetical protein